MVSRPWLLAAPGSGLQIGQRSPCVPPGQADQVLPRVVGEGELPGQAALVDQGAVEHLGDVVVGQRVELEQQAARQQRRDHREERVLRGGGHEGDPPVLDAGQQRVLLRLAEPMDLVDEQHGLAAAVREVAAGAFDRRPHLLDARGDRGDLHERAVGLAADDRRDRGLPGARGSPQKQREGLAALDQLAQRGALGPELGLADELVERPWSHPDGERRGRVRVGLERAGPWGHRSGRSQRIGVEESVHVHRVCGCGRGPGRRSRPRGRTGRGFLRPG